MLIMIVFFIVHFMTMLKGRYSQKKSFILNDTKTFLGCCLNTVVNIICSHFTMATKQVAKNAP